MKRDLFFYLGIIFLVGILGLVFVQAVQWVGSDVTYYINEDVVYFHNLSANISGFNSDITFEIDTGTNKINWTNGSGSYLVEKEEVSAWINILNAITGNLTINSTYDNQTGFFIVPVQANNASGDDTITNFEFQVNATNDAPNFTNINSTYNLSQASPLLEYLNASDEEEHYPLNFSVVFESANCSHASWSGRNANENCSLYDFGFNLTNYPNVSALMNFTPDLNDVGVYWANVSGVDAGENYNCPHVYCDNSTYEQNQTFYYSEIIRFEIFASLSINASDCQNLVANEVEEFVCYVNITTSGSADSLNISSDASLRNYDDTYIYNTSWFKEDESTTSSGNTKSVLINVTPTKNEVGNWSINFSVIDVTANQSDFEIIYIQVDKNDSLDDDPLLGSISDAEASSEIETTIDLVSYDNDLLIPDKNETYGGYNETLNFTIEILSSTATANETFEVIIDSMPVITDSHLTNRTNSHILFNATAEEAGNYTLNVSATDKKGAISSQTFDLVILDNSAPVWNESTITDFTIYENETLYLNFSQNVSDSNGDALTFSYTLLDSETYPFSSMNLTSLGILNFTANDSDVGQHLVNITVSDGYFSDTETFNFSIININDNLSFETPEIQGSGFTKVGNEINVSEDDSILFYFLINDNDLFIPDSQTLLGYYNESFEINLTILNYTGQEVDLFSFVEGTPFTEGQSKFDAIWTPVKADVGNYSVSINVSDRSNVSVYYEFNLTVLEVSHNPNISEIENQSVFVNNSLYFDINATDAEDGNDTSGSFVYSYNFLNGSDFINNNESIFNTTSGIFNFTFNDTQAGKYRINITVNDSSNLTNSTDFWIFVYDYPTINLPLSTETFSLNENETSSLTFQVNHSVGDNLTYLFYLENSDGNDSLKLNTNSYGNSTNYTWQFTPNFTDETYGDVRNLTLVVYASNSDLVNASLYNTTASWNVTINHTNAPVEFSGTIPDKGPTAHTSTITVDLGDYFSDIDFSDTYYNQSVSFSVQSNASSSYISSSVSSGWVLSLDSLIAVVETLNVTMFDLNETGFSLTNATSNNFEVEFVNPDEVITYVTRSSTRTIPVSLKIIVPEPISAFRGDLIVVPLKIVNNGERTLSGINLTSILAKNSILRDDFPRAFDIDFIERLSEGESVDVSLTIDLREVSTEALGQYEVTVNATVESPDYTDWGKFYITIEESDQIYEQLVFVEEFIASNPECAELTEVVEQAKDYFDQGDFVNSLLKVNQAIDACKEAISQPNKSEIAEVFGSGVYVYLFAGAMVVFLAGVSYYFYKRMKLRRSSLELYEINKEKNIKAQEGSKI